MKLLDLFRRIKKSTSKTLNTWMNGRTNFRTRLQTIKRMRRLTAASLLIKMIALVLTSALLPMNGLVIETAVAQEVKLESNLPTLVLSPNNLENMIQIAPREQLTITVTESPAEAKTRADLFKKSVRAISTNSESLADVPLEVKRQLAKSAAAAYGIDWRLVEAVWQIESGKRWKTNVQSSAGAQGPMQFMPGTWRSYATDGNGDGISDVTDARDAVYAGAKYLAANGAATNVDGALLRYNHAQWYVTKVKSLAASIEG